MSAARSQASAARDAAKTSADATKYATDQQIKYLTEGANQGVAQLQPMVDDSIAPNNLLKGAYNIGTPQNLADYNQSYDGSHYSTDAAYNTNKAFEALKSSNAALGKGGAINSGKAQRAAGEQAFELSMLGREAHKTGLKGYVDRGDAARSGIANVRIGQGTGIANAFANQGNALSAIYQQRGQDMQGAIASGASAVGNALSGAFGQMNNGMNWRPAAKTISNAFGFNPPRSPVTSQSGTIKKRI